MSLEIEDEAGSYVDENFAKKAVGYNFTDSQVWSYDGATKFEYPSNLLRLPLQSLPYRPDELNALTSPQVLKCATRFKKTSNDLAIRFLQLMGYSYRCFKAGEVDKATNVMTQFANLASPNSLEGIFAAGLTYTHKTRDFDLSPEFRGQIFQMADAIDQDRTVLTKTADLGLSQVRRARSYLGFGNDYKAQDEVLGNSVLDAWPTIGAEFHFPPDHPVDETFWQRVALWNMTQYQPHSEIPFSAVYDKVLEIRMNPTIYPLAIANWRMLRQILPEIDQSSSFVTICPSEGNFSVSSTEDNQKKNELTNLARLCYLLDFKEVPGKASAGGQVDFGDTHISQTVQFTPNGLVLIGGADSQGQYTIYCGARDNFPTLAYYLSMGFMAPEIISDIPTSPRFTQFGDVARFRNERAKDIGYAFDRTDHRINHDLILKDAHRKGQEIMAEFYPQS